MITTLGLADQGICSWAPRHFVDNNSFSQHRLKSSQCVSLLLTPMAVDCKAACGVKSVLLGWPSGSFLLTFLPYVTVICSRAAGLCTVHTSYFINTHCHPALSSHTNLTFLESLPNHCLYLLSVGATLGRAQNRINPYISVKKLTSFTCLPVNKENWWLSCRGN